MRVSSIFTTESGEWKVAGLEICSSMKEDDAVIFTQGSLVPDIGRYTPPEVVKGGWSSISQHPIHAIDSYGYGTLVSEVFSGGFSGSDQIGSVKNVPQAMQASYRRLTHALPKMRLSVGHFLDQGVRKGGFFDTPLIDLTNGIENLGLKTDTEREAFLGELETVADSDDFPEDFFKVKVLPELLKSVEFGGGGAKPLALVMRVATKLSEDDQKTVSDRIFPQMVTGFGDLAPIVREQTVKAVLIVINKLSDRVINGELLRHLAKTANDEQPGIRTNTTICLGKIARSLGAGSRAKVLTAAFSRALRDPFVHARNAALMALAATADMFSEDDCATKMLPAICPSLVDREKIIRDQANKTMTIYLDRVRKYGSTLPDSVLPPPESQSAGPTRLSTPQPSNQWMGWAISSFTNKVGAASGEIQPNSNGAKPTPTERASSTPPQNGLAVRPNLHSASSANAVPRAGSNLRNMTASPPAVEDEDFGDTWGDMDDNDTSAADAWGSEPTSPRPTSSASTARATSSYDDGGEPDFEGWLNAQAAAKSRSKPLPKGLAAKKAPVSNIASVKPTLASRSSGTAATARTVPTKKADAEKEVSADEDDWGDAWG
ncbi:Nuclear aminoacylation-dependent tRNA export pathway component [Oleoguttula sp. CCFEE 5521]